MNGRCSNYTGCKLAYRGEVVPVRGGEMRCPECGKALELLGSQGATPRKGSSKVLVFGAMGGLLIILLLVGVSAVRQASRVNLPTPAPETPQPVPAAPSLELAAAPPEPAPAAPVDSRPPAPPPGPVAPPAPQELPAFDLRGSENQQVRTEVLKRIDLMPTISVGDKDKLYVSVERARQMGKIASIPFASGRTAPGAADLERLGRELATPEMTRLTSDPTVVLVILGFADTKGDEKVNLRVSQERADNVLKNLRDRAGIKNLMHSVAMGGSTLFDPSGAEKNRVVEVWAVLP